MNMGVYRVLAFTYREAVLILDFARCIGNSNLRDDYPDNEGYAVNSACA